MDNLCVVCGEVIPEGRLVCPRCDAGIERSERMPTVKHGICPWCGRENVDLFYVSGVHWEDHNKDRIKVWIEYICGKCLSDMKALKTEAIQDE